MNHHTLAKVKGRACKRDVRNSGGKTGSVKNYAGGRNIAARMAQLILFLKLLDCLIPILIVEVIVLFYHFSIPEVKDIDKPHLIRRVTI